MMHEEFEQLAGYRVTYDDYHNIIEPMYMATTLSKQDFIETLNRKRFEYIPQKSPEAIALELKLKEELEAINKDIRWYKDKHDMYVEWIHEGDDFWKKDVKHCKEMIKILKRRAWEIKWILSF